MIARIAIEVERCGIVRLPELTGPSNYPIPLPIERVIHKSFGVSADDPDAARCFQLLVVVSPINPTE